MQFLRTYKKISYAKFYYKLLQPSEESNGLFKGRQDIVLYILLCLKGVQLFNAPQLRNLAIYDAAIAPGRCGAEIFGHKHY